MGVKKMDLKGKNVLLIGLAKTGISTIKLLDKLEADRKSVV